MGGGRVSPISIWTSCYLVNGASIDVVALHYPWFIIIKRRILYTVIGYLLD